MADKKITGLTELAEAPADGDLIEVVDVSDETMSANGTNKKVTKANFVSGLGGGSSPRLRLNFNPCIDATIMKIAELNSGTATIANGALTLATNGGSTGEVRWGTHGYITANALDIWNKNPEIVVVARMATTTAGGLACLMFSGANYVHVTTSGGATTAHIGFIWDLAAASSVLFASNANGSTQTTTTLQTSGNVENRTVFRATMVSGTDIKFYENEALSATHTTNLPADGGTAGPNIYTNVENDSGNTTARTLYIYSAEVSIDS